MSDWPLGMLTDGEIKARMAEMPEGKERTVLETELKDRRTARRRSRERSMWERDLARAQWGVARQVIGS